MPGIRDRHRRTVIGVFTGEEFRLRKIPPSEFMQEFGNMPTGASTALTDGLRLLAESLRSAAETKDVETQAKLEQFYLERGVVSPKVFFGPYDDCPEDMIHVDDLSDDKNLLINEIAEWSFGMSEIKKKMGPFLQQQQRDSAGHPGEEVREIADRGSAEADRPTQT